MPSTSRSKLNQLAIDLRELVNQFPSTEEQFKEGLLKFADKIGGTNIAITQHSMLGNKHVLGRIPLLNIFSEQFDPILNDLFHKVSDDYNIRIDFNFLPLKNAFITYKVNDIANKLTIVIDKLDNSDIFFESSTDNAGIKKLGDALYFILNILLRIDRMYQNSKNPANWCNTCFRRAHKDRKYCDVHNSNKDDTAYNKGKEILRPLDENNWIKQRTYHRSIRAYLDAHESKGFLELQKVFEEDINKNDIWSSNRCGIIKDFKLTLPSVTSALKNSMNEQAESWKDFVKSVYLGLGDKIENSTLPLIFVLYIADAEMWLEQENRLIDKRKTNTRDRVIDLTLQNKPRKEISKTLGISKQRISNIFKEIEKKNKAKKSN
jgi:hypothetical protein